MKFVVLFAAVFVFAIGCGENQPTAPENTIDPKLNANLIASVTDDSTSTGGYGEPVIEEDSIGSQPSDSSSTGGGHHPMPPYWRCDDTLFSNVIPKDLIQEPYLGNNGAKAVIVVAGNLSDEYLRAWWPQLMKLHNIHPYDLKIVFVNMEPSSTPVWPPREKFLARACEAAAQLGKFWEFADVVVKKRPHPTVDEVYNYAEEAGIDFQRFKREMNRDRTMAEVESDYTFTRGFGQRTCCQFYDGSGECITETHNTSLFIGAPWLGYFRFFAENHPALEDVSEAVDLLNCGQKCFKPMKPKKEPPIVEQPGPTTANANESPGLPPVFDRLN